MSSSCQRITLQNSVSFFLCFSATLDANDLKNGDPTLTVMSAGHVLSVFINGEYQGNLFNLYYGGLCHWIVFCLFIMEELSPIDLNIDLQM